MTISGLHNRLVANAKKFEKSRYFKVFFPLSIIASLAVVVVIVALQINNISSLVSEPKAAVTATAYQGASGVVVMEAENMTSNISRSGTRWVEDSDKSNTIKYMVTNNRKLRINSVNDLKNSPELIYSFKTGLDSNSALKAFARVFVPKGAADIFFWGFDGVPYGMTSTNGSSQSGWTIIDTSNSLLPGKTLPSLSSNVAHTFHIWRGTDGFRVDRIYLFPSTKQSLTASEIALPESKRVASSTTVKTLAIPFTSASVCTSYGESTTLNIGTVTNNWDGFSLATTFDTVNNREVVHLGRAAKGTTATTKTDVESYYFDSTSGSMVYLNSLANNSSPKYISGTLGSDTLGGITASPDGLSLYGIENAQTTPANPPALEVQPSSSLMFKTSSDTTSASYNEVTTRVGSTGTANPYQYTWPNGIAIDGNNHLYVSDMSKARILIFNAATLWSTGGSVATSYIGSYQLPVGDLPINLAYDSVGNSLWVSDNTLLQNTGTHKVTRLALNADGTISPAAPIIVTTVNGHNISPDGITTDENGNAFVIDRNGTSASTRIVKINASGAVMPLTITTSGSSALDGPTGGLYSNAGFIAYNTKSGTFYVLSRRKPYPQTLRLTRFSCSGTISSTPTPTPTPTAPNCLPLPTGLTSTPNYTCNAYTSTFSWNAVAGATGYLFKLDDPSDGAVCGGVYDYCPTTPVTVTSQSLRVVAGRNYNWSVQAVNATTSASCSPATSSLNVSCVSAPTAAILDYRLNCGTTNSVIFTWGMPAGYTSSTLEKCADRTCTSVTSTLLNNSTATTYTASNQVQGATDFYRLKLSNGTSTLTSNVLVTQISCASGTYRNFGGNAGCNNAQDCNLHRASIGNVGCSTTRCINNLCSDAQNLPPMNGCFINGTPGVCSGWSCNLSNQWVLPTP